LLIFDIRGSPREPWRSVGMGMGINIPPWGRGWRQKFPRKQFGAGNGDSFLRTFPAPLTSLINTLAVYLRRIFLLNRWVLSPWYIILHHTYHSNTQKSGMLHKHSLMELFIVLTLNGNVFFLLVVFWCMFFRMDQLPLIFLLLSLLFEDDCSFIMWVLNSLST
jgi:hypothetical protein